MLSLMEFVNWVRPPHGFALPANEIHIWRARLDTGDEERERLAALLSKEEMARAHRFVFPEHRNHFVVGRGKLRELLGAYLNCPPDKLEFEIAQFGKLSLTDHPEACFNLSHSGGLALYAFALSREVGIDVEKFRAEFASEAIADRYFSLQERQQLRELPEQLRREGFFLCWTRKEAYVKAHGAGLQIPLDSFDVSLTPGEPETLRSMDSERWTLRAFTPEPGYAAAIVGEGKFESMVYWDADAARMLP